MIKNYLKIAFRNLWRHRAFSFINIMGLTVGLTAAFLIFLYVRFELSYDTFHSKGDRVYRVVADIKTPTEVIPAHGPAWAVPSHLKMDFPEVETFTRVSNNSFLIRRGDVKFQETESIMADSSFFQVFDFKMIKGNPKTALVEPFSIVMTESTAKKYFGKENPVGQTVLFTVSNRIATVTGVIADMPENTRINANLLVSMSTLTKIWAPNLDNEWGNYGSEAYVLLKPGTNAKALQSKFPAFLEKRVGKEMKESQMYATLILEKLKEVYLYSTRNGNKTGNINNVYIFSVVAVFILMIACINFVNLTTARASERAKEVGIRKVVGALKTQLTGQFMGESVILCLLAFVLSVGATALMLPLFNRVADKEILTGIFSNARYLLILLAAAVGIGLLAGAYPALVLSSFKPIVVLKGRFATGTRGIFLRKALVISQFTISIALIIGTIIVYRQMNFMRTRDLGFTKDQMLVLNTNGDSTFNALMAELKTVPGIKAVAASGSVPGGGHPGAYSVIENVKGEDQIANLDLYFVDFDYIPLYKMKMAAGRPFSRDFMTDTTQAMVLNEAAVKMFGYATPEQAIGRRFKQWGREGKIIGVVKDFHFHALQEPIKPLSMRMEIDRFSMITANVSAAGLPQTIKAVEKAWKKTTSHRPFDYNFLDEFYDRQYKGEERFGKLFLNFAILAIFISCLGLLGLASYSTMQRTKEIGIRKVMGASVTNIVQLISKDFLLLVAISFVLAAPIAWYFMHKWLNDFAYRTDIAWWVFGVSGVLALAIALFTISFLSIKAAIANPVKSLRTE